MNESVRDTMRAAETAVGRLVEECRKAGPLYVRSPRLVAQVSRTGKWLLNAIAALRQEVEATGTPASTEQR